MVASPERRQMLAGRKDKSFMVPNRAVQPARHVLVVDDDANLREQIVGYLQEHGFVLHEAGDAASMEAVLAQEAVDLIILDLMLPGEDGLSICRRLAGSGGPAILMMSAM